MFNSFALFTDSHAVSLHLAATGKDIFSLDKIFFPVNVSRTHWVVTVAFMQEKKIQFYDSLGDRGDEWLEAVFQYIKDEHMDKKKCPLPDEDQWELVPCARGTPRQLNGMTFRLN
jgi:Ulp1 family protease